MEMHGQQDIVGLTTSNRGANKEQSPYHGAEFLDVFIEGVLIDVKAVAFIRVAFSILLKD